MLRARDRTTATTNPAALAQSDIKLLIGVEQSNAINLLYSQAAGKLPNAQGVEVLKALTDTILWARTANVNTQVQKSFGYGSEGRIVGRDGRSGRRFG